METEIDFRVAGVVVVDAATGRALRKAPAAIPAACVLDCSGDFRGGERVYVTMRGRDGGQYAVAIGTAVMAAAALRGGAEQAGAGQAGVAIAAERLQLLWPTPAAEAVRAP